MSQFAVGTVAVDRIEEWDGWPAPAAVFFPDADDAAWRVHAELVGPQHHDPVTGLFRATMQSWLLRHDGRTALVDAGVGNDKQRPNPGFHEQRFPFLERLAETGTRPEDVDTVLLTHLHVDHVGWNTTLVDGAWTPTFPNARYVIHRAELEFWNPANGHASRGGDINENVWDDSIAPVLDAGLVDVWEGSYRLDDTVELVEATGHTPGSAVVRVTSHGDTGVFTGDLAHSPLQLAVPDLCTCFCEDPGQSARSRRAVLERAADEHSTVFPGHFGAARAVRIARSGSAFTVDSWIDPATDPAVDAAGARA